MYVKAVAMIVFIAAVAAATLSLRQQRWEATHQVTQMHKQIEQSRRSVWESQVKVAALLKPSALKHRIAIANLDLVPLIGAPTQQPAQPTPPRQRAAQTRQPARW